MFAPFSIIVASIFEHRFHIDFVSMLGWSLISLLILFDTFFRSRTQPAKPPQINAFAMMLHVFYISENIAFYNVDDFSDTYFGIDFGCDLASVLFPFWHPFNINVRVLGCSF